MPFYLSIRNFLCLPLFILFYFFPSTLVLGADIDDSVTAIESASNWYVRVDVGYSTNDIETDEYGDLGRSIPISAGVGVPIPNNGRIEFTANHFSNFDDPNNNVSMRLDPDTNTLVPFHFSETPQVSSVMFNVYQDFDGSGGIRPYLGVGVGAAGFSSFDTSIAPAISGNGMAGFAKKVSDHAWIDLGYRYTYVGSVDLSRSTEESGALSIHEARIGLRYELW